jgi:hypothetical protein
MDFIHPHPHGFRETMKVHYMKNNPWSVMPHMEDDGRPDFIYKNISPLVPHLNGT